MHSFAHHLRWGRHCIDFRCHNSVPVTALFGFTPMVFSHSKVFAEHAASIQGEERSADAIHVPNAILAPQTPTIAQKKTRRP